MVGSNYPPGTSRRDLVRGGIIEPHNHECEWIPEFRDGPIIEDGAAIFHETCNYAEGRYGDGFQCENERSYRFEYDTLEVPVVEEEIELETISDWEDMEQPVRDVIIYLEAEFLNGNDDVDLAVDPDPDYGEVAISHCGFTLSYRP